VQVIVQSSHKSASQLDERVEAFLLQYRKELQRYLDSAQPDALDKLREYVSAVCEKLLERPKNIDQEAARYWEEVKVDLSTCLL
jgi:secreted Zn-dependent insulinase-like peptidase